VAAVCLGGCALEYLSEGPPLGPGGSGVGAGAGGAVGSGGNGGSSSTGGSGEGAGGPSNEDWAFAYGSGEDLQEGTAVAVDRTCAGGGCPLLVGFFADAIDLGGETLVATVGDPIDVDMFVAKFDADGKHLWSKDFGDDREQRARSVVADVGGNVLMTGFYRGEIDFGRGTPFVTVPTYRNDVFVTKFAPDGAHVWSRSFGGKADGTDGDHQNGESIAVNGDGDVYVAGSFTGAITFEGVQHTATDGQDIFLLKLDPAGERLWSKAWDGAGSNNLPNVAVGPDYHVYLAGHFTGTLDLGCNPALDTDDDDDAFIAKLSGDTGACLWAKQFGDGGTAQPARAVAPMPNGDVVVVIELNGGIDFGDGNVPGAARDVVVARLSGDTGDVVWGYRAVDPKEQYVTDVAVDADGSVVLAGSYTESLTMDPEQPDWVVKSAGESDIFLARLDLDGALLWAQGFGSYANDYGRSVAVDGEGHALLTGAFRGEIDFGTTQLTSNGFEQDVFLAKFGPQAP
jgi:hypothetical protein